MNKFATLILGIGLLGLVGCSGGNSADETPKLQGKADIQEAPKGAPAPGESRGSSGGGNVRDGDK